MERRINSFNALSPHEEKVLACS